MKAKLLVVHGRPKGKALQFPHGEFLIGRGQECHVRPNSEWVSRQHCLLRVTADTVHLCDLGSTNGTLVNGQRLLTERLLKHGDQVQVGPLLFEVVLEENTPPAPALPVPRPMETREICLDTAEQKALALALEPPHEGSTEDAAPRTCTDPPPPAR